MNGPYLTSPLEQINAAWKQGRDNAFQEQEGNALTSTGAAQQQALSNAAQLNPAGSLDMAQKNQQVNGQKLVNMARLLVNAPDSQKDAIYQSLKPTLGAVGIDPSTLPSTYDDTVAQTAKSLVTAYTPTNQIPAAVRTDQYFTQGLNDDQKAQHQLIKAGLAARATAENWQTKEVPDGQGGTITLVHNSRTNQWEQPDFSSIQNGNKDYSATSPPPVAPAAAPAPASVTGKGWETTIAKPDAAQIANSVLDRGGTPDEAGVEVQRQVGPNQPTAISLNPQTGRFENLPMPAGAVPQRLDEKGNDITAPAAPAAPASGGIGYAPPKKDTNEIAKRKENLQQFASAGITLTPDEQQQYLLDGKPPAQAEKPLTSDQEAMAQKIAHYGLDTPARFLGDPKNAPVIARAIAINPDWSQGNYALNNAYLKDVQSNSPTSTGGGIVAANTALSHLQAMSDLSERLPDYPSDLIGQPATWIAARGKGPVGDDLKSWDTESQLMAAEVQKMIKSGVATEGETKAMLANLAPSAPRSQRNMALARLAEFMNDKVAEQETKRDQVLGAASPGTSFLNAASQDKLRNVLDRGNQEVPNLRPPSTTLRTATQANAQPPSGGGPTPAPVRVSSQADFDALPSGALFINPKDGKILRKN